MSLRIECLTIDCEDLHVVASFWEHALGYRRTYEDDTEVALSAPDDVRANDVLILRVPDRKQGKNRLHLDLRPDDQSVEVQRLVSLGATHIEIGQAGDESWVVMADPEGNEFCVLRVLGSDDQPYEGDVGFAAPN